MLRGGGQTGALFVPQRVDGMKPGGADGGQEAERDADRGAEEKTDHGPLHGHARLEVGEYGHQIPQPEPHYDADQSPDVAENDGLQEELTQDARALRTQRLPDPDLAGP